MIRSETPQRTQESLNFVATVESIGSWNWIEGSKLSDREVERLLSNLQTKSFAARDGQEVLIFGRTRPAADGRLSRRGFIRTAAWFGDLTKSPSQRLGYADPKTARERSADIRHSLLRHR